MIPFIIPLVAGVASYFANRAAQKRQNKANMGLAQFQADANERYLDKQNEYNTPANQMARYKQAGLNPNLIYGQGNPGNQSQPLSYPEIGRTDYQRGMDLNLLPLINQTMMTQSQVQATDAKTRQTTVLTALNQLQTRVLAANPLLDNEGFKATIDSLKSAAEIKASEATVAGIRSSFANAEDFRTGLKFEETKLFRELDLLEQKYKLGSLDGKIKAEVLSSKSFQNDILEIQKRWMVDGEITPQHILQFLQLILMKAMTPGFGK